MMKRIDLVNIKQGSKSVRRFSRGNTLPLVCRPNALSMFAPQTDSSRGPWFYHPEDRSFEGVRLTHQASPWVGDYSYICFMPEIDELVTDPALRWSGFRPEKAVLRPNLMEYELLRTRTKFRLAPTNSGAIMTVESSNLSDKQIFAIIPADFKTEIKVDKESRSVSGYTCSYTAAPYRDDFKCYFYITFDCDVVGEETKAVGSRANATGVVLADKNYTKGIYDLSLTEKIFTFKSADEAFAVLKNGKAEFRNNVLLHGDYCLPNVMLKDSFELSGFIDVGNGGIGDRHIDVFWGTWTLWFNLKTDKYRSRFIDAYGRDKINEEMLRVIAAAEVFG